MNAQQGGSGEVLSRAEAERLLGREMSSSASSTRFYVGEPGMIRVALPARNVRPEILGLHVTFPSGATAESNYAIDDGERAAGQKLIDGVVSGEAGELDAVATVRYEDGSVQRRAEVVPVFTRNPVQMYITPTFLTKSGAAGAPQYNFSERRWYCRSGVRWVNSTSQTVNLGRQVTVRMTDAGTHIGTFSFDLSGDVVIPANQTVYGNIATIHNDGSPPAVVYSNKGDLLYEYRMSGSGFTPTRNQVWRAMRVIGYNIIRVGNFTTNEQNEYRRAAATVASGIFRSRDMTVHGVERYRIGGTPDMDADLTRFRFIDNQAEMNEMRNRYTVSENWFLDVFFVEGRWDGAFGSSPTNGPANKEGPDSGLVLRRDGDTVNLGQTFAHEAGHYLGLEHADANDGCPDTDPSSPDIDDNFIFSSSRRDSTVVTGCQIDKMRRHDLVRALTPP